MDQNIQDLKIQYARQYGADEHVLSKTWDNFVVTTTMQKSIELIRNLEYFKAPGAYFYGTAGSGKSHIMKAIFNTILDWKVELHQKGTHSPKKPYWVYMSQYLEALRNDQSAKKTRAMEATVLFIDDLGANTKTDWVVDQIFQLIDHRSERELQTYITANLTLDELSSQYGERIASRICGMCLPVKMIASDFRQKQMKQNYRAAEGRLKSKGG